MDAPLSIRCQTSIQRAWAREKNEIVLIFLGRVTYIRAPPPSGICEREAIKLRRQSGLGDVDSLWTDRSRSRCTTFCWRKVKRMEVGRMDVATPEGKPVRSSSGVESELAIAEDGVKETGVF